MATENVHGHVRHWFHARRRMRAGPLDGYLQCDDDMCAWADYSGIVVVSQSSPDQPGTG